MIETKTRQNNFNRTNTNIYAKQRIYV